MIIKGKISQLVVQAYKNSEGFALTKIIQETELSNHGIYIDIDSNLSHFNGFPFIMEGIKVTIHGEFKFGEASNQSSVGETFKRHRMNIDIIKLDKIELDT